MNFAVRQETDDRRNKLAARRVDYTALRFRNPCRQSLPLAAGGFLSPVKRAPMR